MIWLIFVVITLLSDSFRIFLDNYVSDTYFNGRGSVSQKIFHGTLQCLVGLGVLCAVSPQLISALWETGSEQLGSWSQLIETPVFTIVTFFLSGFFISFAGIPYYKALELDDSTNLGIFIQLAPILYLVLGWLFLGETISFWQIIAFAVILSAPLLILFNTRKRSREVKLKAIMFAFIYVAITVVCNLMFVKENTASLETPSDVAVFAGELAIFFIGKGVSSIIMVMCNKKWRRRFGTVLRRHPRKLPRLLVANTALGIVSDSTYRLAMAAAPTVALASAASDSVEPIVIFFMGLVLTLMNPRFGREQLNRKAIMVHLGATVLVVIGVVLIQTT